MDLSARDRSPARTHHYFSAENLRTLVANRIALVAIGVEQSSRQKAMSLGWYVPPLTADGLVSLTGFRPSSTQKRGLIVQRPAVKK
jgi:hypothetical protein